MLSRLTSQVSSRRALQHRPPFAQLTPHATRHVSELPEPEPATKHEKNLRSHPNNTPLRSTNNLSSLSKKLSSGSPPWFSALSQKHHVHFLGFSPGSLGWLSTTQNQSKRWFSGSQRRIRKKGKSLKKGTKRRSRRQTLRQRSRKEFRDEREWVNLGQTKKLLKRKDFQIYWDTTCAQDWYRVDDTRKTGGTTPLKVNKKHAAVQTGYVLLTPFRTILTPYSLVQRKRKVSAKDTEQFPRSLKQLPALQPDGLSRPFKGTVSKKNLPQSPQSSKSTNAEDLKKSLGATRDGGGLVVSTTTQKAVSNRSSGSLSRQESSQTEGEYMGLKEKRKADFAMVKHAGIFCGLMGFAIQYEDWYMNFSSFVL